MALSLVRNPKWKARRGPVVLCILDGVGYSRYPEGDAVQQANMVHFKRLEQECPMIRLKAHGTAVGLPGDGDMGNSEVGHNAMGAGRIFDQGAKLVQNALTSGSLYEGETWQKTVQNVKENKGTLHFIGLISDGNVHSHWNHLKMMLEQAKKEGVARVCVHGLTDGRDVSERSALDYFQPLEDFLAELGQDGHFDGRIASGGGRMVLTMDRYEADWTMVERGWQTHVLGRGRQFSSACEAIRTLYDETGKTDQNLDPFVVAENGKPVGAIQDGDSVLLFNFRGDRAIEISRAFDEAEFAEFDRVCVPKVFYAGIIEYDGDLHVPKNYLISPPAIDRTIGEYLADMGVSQFVISETQKYGHVTYFFNGNRSGKFSENETYQEIPSDRISFEQGPEMKVDLITDAVVGAIESGKYQFIRLNYANGDMVGHTGDFRATICALEKVDEGLGRLLAAVEKAGGVLLTTADHGNADEMYEIDKKTGALNKNKVKTSHTLNPVPFIVFDPENGNEYGLHLREGLGIGSVASTCLHFLGYLSPGDYLPSIIELR
ncbi:2,3-bisphosphoglycerate-independent phosphoglycerate mutase [Candidatus Haliotispira prima]|uniref:2,3-bisphosphoglycerate-independent phosphoglycerate mutase n=1 Tax=Candidatus Haliotispira prima TaxID=3034016 RepID=A0ABY8MH21_9SPIO|nr:2,3-bisphosphoglycerate-independent phosphoglycerate mutase [Candidatus Haliotispira prima]